MWICLDPEQCFAKELQRGECCPFLKANVSFQLTAQLCSEVQVLKYAAEKYQLNEVF